MDAGTVSTGSLAFTSSNTARNLIVVALRIGNTATQSTVTDSRGNTYQLAASQNQTTDGSRALIYYAANIAGGANTVSIHLNGSATLRFGIYEYAGVSTLDRVASAQGDTGTSLSSGNTTATSQAHELVFALAITADPVAYTAGTGYTQRHAVSGKFLTEDRIVNAIGAYGGAASASPASRWAIVVVTLPGRSPHD